MDLLSAARAAIDSTTARRMLDDFIWTNLSMLKKSRTPYVLRNLCAAPVIRGMITRLPGKARTLLRRQGAAR